MYLQGMEVRVLDMDYVLLVISQKWSVSSEIIRGLKLIFEQLGKPKQLYSDEESSLRSQGFIIFVNEDNIKTIHALAHAHTIERFIYTFKMNLYRRLDGSNQDKKRVG